VTEGAIAIPERPTAATLATDGDWDDFVTRSANGSYTQLAAWAAVKAVNGWAAVRIVAPTDAGSAGAQVLVRRVSPTPWSVGYAPRGPVLSPVGPGWVGPFTTAVRDRLAGRVCGVTIDPEIEADGPADAHGSLRAALVEAGWRSTAPIQPDRSRLLDLTVDEAALWSGLRSKWRQYVNGARRLGVKIDEGGEGQLAEFYAIYRETASRAGFIIRSESAYRDVWRAFAPAGRARLLLARHPDGTAVACLLLLRCGERVVEPYGGMTAAGAQTRANYLLKWEAIRTSRERGATVYDMWGLSHPGIAHFKSGFGGRDVRYIGAYRLVIDRLGSRAIDLARRADVWIARRRHGLPGAAPE
jgi:lipid II:glycine glycyltransferase (peptidoglycan interpeptide bridge formation enzyme)